ncbi:MAG: hypothetical protein Q9M50_14435 [Methylococcales bacterium]|nr:hypothetical protein [Methylococcales bacterium]
MNVTKPLTNRISIDPEKCNGKPILLRLKNIPMKYLIDVNIPDSWPVF